MGVDEITSGMDMGKMVVLKGCTPLGQPFDLTDSQIYIYKFI